MPAVASGNLVTKKLQASKVKIPLLSHVIPGFDPLLTLANDRFLVAHVLTALSSQDFAPARSWRSTSSTASTTACG